jgi:hypothetical protein
LERLPRKYHHKAVFYRNPTDDSSPVGEQGIGFTKCLHKKPWSESPYLIANEIIAAKLGQFLGLPIPPFAVTHSASGQQFPDRMGRFDIGVVSEKSDDLLQVNWGNRQAEWH